MGKFKELSIAIEEIESSAKKVLKDISKLKVSFATSEEDWNNCRDEEIAREEAEERKATATIPEIVLTLEEVRKTLAGYSRNGKTAEVKALLQKYGANRLSEIKPQDYESLLKDAEVLK